VSVALALALALAAAPGGHDEQGEGDPCGERQLCLRAGSTALWPTAALRAGYEYQTPDDDISFVGVNDGFRLDQARVGLDFASGPRVRARLLGDGARLLPGAAPNDPVRRLGAGLVDAWVAWEPLEYFGVRVGQTRMPGDREGMTARGEMIFATRSVAASGVEPGRGLTVRGLSTGRDLGVVLGAERAPVGPLLLDYRFALANGNGGNVSANDNKLPAAYARTGVAWGEHVSLALGGSWNPRTVGEVPNQQDETDLTGFVELHAHLWKIDALLLGLVRQVTFDSALPEPTDDNRAAFGHGATAWLVLEAPLLAELVGLRLGYRASYLAPPVSLPEVTLVEHAFAARADPPWLGVPAGFVVDVTNVWEVDGGGLRSMNDARVFGLVQLSLF
jgi:hypothetical protein